MDILIASLIDAYRQAIEALDWMGADTRRRALDKLGKFTPKIGYPVGGGTTPRCGLTRRT